ncbi:ATPase [Candidatus Phycosocius spiralis]|uniref:histidine kinase n=2 Tax=Candidatus Phycosocius spiralis TaxID=2815099 RepID=A0ABQ4PVK3_9PROT|nr:ATPase [Candidatus Phycosocius spiralis]
MIGAGFILLTEALLFVPTMANYRDDWLMNRLRTAEMVALTSANPRRDGLVGGQSSELIRAADIQSIAILQNPPAQDAAAQTPLRLEIVGAPPRGPIIRVEPEIQTIGTSILGVLATYTAPHGRYLRIIGRPQTNAAIRLEAIVAEAPLKEALLHKTWQVLFSILALSLTIGALIYAALIDGFIRPMRKLTHAIARFSVAPTDASRAFVPTGRSDEIGQAEVAFSSMQEAVRSAFLQKDRLAQLGLAVSKIAHDLRHSLGAAHLVSERLSSVDDPVVRATAPRLERALQRAINLAQSTLSFGKAQERPPEIELIYLSDALDEAADEALTEYKVSWSHDVANDLEVEIDAEHLHRILTNLIRNAAQAIIASGQAGSVRASVKVKHSQIDLHIIDTGPGLPKRVQEHLFTPFAGSGLKGGAGLGLAISLELARLNGGDIILNDTGPKGTDFIVRLVRDQEEVANSKYMA